MVPHLSVSPIKFADLQLYEKLENHYCKTESLGHVFDFLLIVPYQSFKIELIVKYLILARL
jgi:hypothetical protein